MIGGFTVSASGESALTVTSPADYQKVSRFLTVAGSADIGDGDSFVSLAAVIDGKTFPLVLDGDAYNADIDFMAEGISNQKVHDLDVVLTTANGADIKSFRIPYILSGSMLTYFTDSGQISDFSNGGSWESGFNGPTYEPVTLGGVPTGLLRCDFVATHTSSGWQEIKPILWFGKYNLSGVQAITYDVYVPYYSTAAPRNDNWNLNSKIVLDGGIAGYLEIPGFNGQTLNSNTYYSTVTGPDRTGAGTANWRKRSVSIDVSTVNLNDWDNITLGLVLSGGTTFNTPLYIGNIQFVSSETVPRTQIYDYFDGYLGDTGWFNSLNAVDNATAEISPDYVQFGTNGLKLTVNENGFPGSVAIDSRAPYTVNPKTLAWNAAAYTNFYFWVKPDGAPGQSLTVDITAGAFTYRAAVTLNETTEYYRINIPFANFQRVDAPANNLGAQANRSGIANVKFTLNAGSVCIDRIYAHTNAADPNNSQPELDVGGFTDRGGAPVDAFATDETKSLFHYLRNVMLDGTKVLFGHQQSTMNGLTMTDFSGYQSDIKAGVNDYPAVIGFDTMTYMWSADNVRYDAERAIIAAKELGCVITLASHVGNFYTEGAYNNYSAQAFNTTNGVLVNGSPANQRMAAHFEMVAEFLLLCQEAGVPVIYRPWHENVVSGGGTFFWWHAATAAQYRQLWQWTYDFLQARGVHNVLYCYSPNTASVANINTLYTAGTGTNNFYPGDAYVDVFGYDTYTTTYTGTGTNTTALVPVMNAVYTQATTGGRNKIAALSETGSNTNGNAPPNTYFTSLLGNLMGASNNSRFTAYVLTWVNYGPDNYFVPWPEYGNTPEHSAFSDFVNFYNDSRTVFANQTGGYNAVYKWGREPIPEYTITASASGGSAGIDPVGTVKVPYGGDMTYTITANTGDYDVAVTVDGYPAEVTFADNTATYTFANVTENHTINVETNIKQTTFVCAVKTLTANVGAAQQIAYTYSGPESGRPAFTSSNAGICAVDDDGMLTPMKAGMAIVTVRCGAVTVTIVVTVK